MDAGVGWIAAIIIGGIAGWLAEQFIKSDMGGWLGYLIVGFIGACLLIWIVRMVKGTRAA